MTKKLWVVGEALGDPTDPDNTSWGIVGVFDSEELALENCTKYNYFIGPIDLNVAFPEEPCEWPNAYFPSESESNGH